MIESLRSLKQKKQETIGEFYERFMVEAAKINTQPNNHFKITWFLNALNREYAKHIGLMPIGDLNEAKASTQKLEIGQMKKGNFLHGGGSDGSSDDSEETWRKKQKLKTKTNESTNDEIKTLKEEIEGLALENKKNLDIHNLSVVLK